MKDMSCTYHMIIIDGYGWMDHQGESHTSDWCLKTFFKCPFGYPQRINFIKDSDEDPIFSFINRIVMHAAVNKLEGWILYHHRSKNLQTISYADIILWNYGLFFFYFSNHFENIKE